MKNITSENRAKYIAQQLNKLGQKIDESRHAPVRGGYTGTIVINDNDGSTVHTITVVDGIITEYTT